MVFHTHSSTIKNQFLALDQDRANGYIQALCQEGKQDGLFHKVGSTVVQGAFERKVVLPFPNAQAVFQALFVDSGFLGQHLIHTDCHSGFDELGNEYNLPADVQRFSHAVLAHDATPLIKIKRYGLKRKVVVGVIPWNVDICEDQYIRPADLLASYDALCLENSATMRTIRQYQLKDLNNGSVEVTMHFGACFTGGFDPNQAAAVRDRTFQETSQPEWVWATLASNYLQQISGSLAPAAGFAPQPVLSSAQCYSLPSAQTAYIPQAVFPQQQVR